MWKISNKSFFWNMLSMYKGVEVRCAYICVNKSPSTHLIPFQPSPLKVYKLHFQCGIVRHASDMTCCSNNVNMKSQLHSCSCHTLWIWSIMWAAAEKTVFLRGILKDLCCLRATDWVLIWSNCSTTCFYFFFLPPPWIVLNFKPEYSPSTFSSTW